MDSWLVAGAFTVGVVVGLAGLGGGALMTPMLVFPFGVPTETTGLPLAIVMFAAPLMWMVIRLHADLPAFMFIENQQQKAAQVSAGKGDR